ncbi:PREDICTED: lisH domain and HEAT repeat-containing protein KIAA1468 [Lupinus angustifolius]|uniref:lisH domain and HEAT repeat-containing protein KIAA1468 n=1 Tax=Lupinus angustifolius TaxID=3871 RepID=UPI00092F75D8|nr:PREDICTED: lisH domain and HEAT repeat-containing protein KIAA1468 [Lupinus angustifolius]
MREMDVERTSLCNLVVNFLLEHHYFLTAFELLHELLDDGRDHQAIRLQNYFSDSSLFPPHQISRLNSLRVADPQTLLEEKEAAEEKLAISGYELRLAQEDILKLKSELQKKAESPSEPNAAHSSGDVSVNDGQQILPQKKDISFTDLGPLKDTERRDLNCAVKEYLLIAGYRLTAMTFYEEVTDQNLDIWHNTPASVPDALRHYYYQYLSSTSEAAEEKFNLLRENETLLKSNKRLTQEKDTLLKKNDLADAQISAFTKSLEAMQKDLKDKDDLVQGLKQSLEFERKELNDCRVEITSLKMLIAASHSGNNLVVSDVNNVQSQSVEKYEEEIKKLRMEVEWLKEKNIRGPENGTLVGSENEILQTEDKVIEIHEDRGAISNPGDVASGVVSNEDAQSPVIQTLNEYADKHEDTLPELFIPAHTSSAFENNHHVSEQDIGQQALDSTLLVRPDTVNGEAISEKTGLGTIQILADALPKIVPYVLINHREELLPLIMCAIERHPDSSTRDSLTHTLFNLIKRPDEQQRRIIMDACVCLAQNVGEMRTETELLPQCWEQISHTYEERRLLVAQSCGELAGFVRHEIRDSLILSIVQQLIEDSASVVREAAARNLSMLLPLFPNVDKYFKVEELMFQLICDPSGVVVESTLKDLVPAVIKWGNNLDHVLKVLLSHILSSAQRCPPLSGVEGSMESHLRVLGERERWNIDILLRLLMELLPFVHHKAIETCPFSSTTETTQAILSTTLLDLYARGQVEWDAFEWMHVECFPNLIQLACLLPQKDDNLRNRISKFLLSVSQWFGDCYTTCIMLPVFLIAVGDDANLTYFPSAIHSRIRGLRPRSAIADRLSTMCVLPLLLAGVLGAPGKSEQLSGYLRKLLLEDTSVENRPTKHTPEIINAIHFICIYEENHGLIFNILWEMVVSSNVNMKINAAKLLKVIVPHIDAKVASTHVLPALITLGSDQNMYVKYASIDAFGSVAQHFKNDMIVDKIRVQMDAFLEDGSHEATIAVIRALVVAVPHTTERLRDYLLSKILQLTAMPNAASDLMRRRERVDVFCEAIRALDATDLPVNSVRDFLLPAIHNLLKDLDALDPAHKEALEIIMKERSGGTFDTLKGMGAHLGLPSSVSNFFGDSGLLGKKETVESPSEAAVSPNATTPPVEDTRLRRLMMGNFSEMLRGKAKAREEGQNQ